MAPQAVLIAGPTASGKSAVALALAERLGATIVNADSMQVYAGLRVLTARPAPAEEARAPHRLYGHVDPAEAYSVGRWLAEAAALLQESAERPLIFVGGTGLYFEALTRGLATVPQVPAAVRAAVRAEAEGRSASALHAGLAGRDPSAATSIRPSDRQRILRALEVLAATGRPLSAWQAEAPPPLVPPETATRVVLAVERAQLRRLLAYFRRHLLNVSRFTEYIYDRRIGRKVDLPQICPLNANPFVASREPSADKYQKWIYFISHGSSPPPRGFAKNDTVP
jgi:tRNA dimethylallyltransferase